MSISNVWITVNTCWNIMQSLVYFSKKYLNVLKINTESEKKFFKCRLKVMINYAQSPFMESIDSIILRVFLDHPYKGKVVETEIQ